MPKGEFPQRQRVRQAAADEADRIASSGQGRADALHAPVVGEIVGDGQEDAGLHTAAIKVVQTEEETGCTRKKCEGMSQKWSF